MQTRTNRQGETRGISGGLAAVVALTLALAAALQAGIHRLASVEVTAMAVAEAVRQTDNSAVAPVDVDHVAVRGEGPVIADAGPVPGSCAVDPVMETIDVRGLAALPPPLA